MLVRRLFLASLLFATACPDTKATEPKTAPVASPAITKTATVAEPETSELMATAFVRLNDEAKSRPAGTVKVEAVLEALKAAGVPFIAGQQVLGVMVNAKYCWQTASEDGAVASSICEYATEEELKAGQAKSAAITAFGDRIYVQNGRTLFGMKIMKPGSEPIVEKAKAAFLALKP